MQCAVTACLCVVYLRRLEQEAKVLVWSPARAAHLRHPRDGATGALLFFRSTH